MSQVAFVIERKVQYHGIWNTGLQLTDQFIKKIAEEYISKPACPTFLKLSSTSLSLVVFSKEGAMLRTDHIVFDALREVAVNSYAPKCLLILYVNSTNKYSVLVCSCQDNKEAVNISLAYKQLKNIRLVNQQERQNWILRRSSFEKVENGTAAQNGIDTTDGNLDSDDGSFQPSEKEEDSISTRSRTPSGVMNDTFAFLNNEDDTLADDEDVFVDHIVREPVSGDDSNAFHVGMQVDLSDDLESPISRSVSFKSMKDELDAVAQETDGTTPTIAEEEYYKTAVNGEQQNGLHTDEDANDNEENDIHTEDLASPKRVSTDESDSYDFRSIGTLASFVGGGRYKKRPGSVGSSNVYKTMAAQRKHTSFVQPAPVVTQPTPSSANGNYLRARPSSYHGGRPGVSYQSLFLPRQVHVSSTSVSRPIEEVYHSLRKKRVQARSNSRKMMVQHRNNWFPKQ